MNDKAQILQPDPADLPAARGSGAYEPQAATATGSALPRRHRSDGHMPAVIIRSGAKVVGVFDAEHPAALRFTHPERVPAPNRRCGP